MATPLMGLDLPVAGVTEGPSYAALLISALEVVDGHTHASGSGARITTAALLIDADLSFASNFATSVKGTKYSDQVAVFGTGDVFAVYSVNGDLHWNNGAGTAVRITDGVGLNASSIGGIGGDYGSSTADVSYSDATKTFSFTQSAGVAAKMATGEIAIFEEIVSASSVTLKSPSALAGSYSITLLAALPANNGVTAISSAGVMTVVAAPGANSILQSTSGGVLSWVTTLPTAFKATSMELTTPKIADSTGGQFYNFASSDLAADRIVTLPLLTGGDTFVFEAHAQTLTNKTITAAVLSGSFTGTYTLAGTPTITAPAISAPVFSGTATGTYTLGGTPTITAPTITGGGSFAGTFTGTYTLAGTPTITAPAISGPTLSGTVLGTYTLGGTPTYGAGTLSGTLTSSGGGLAGTFTGQPTFSGNPIFSHASGLSTNTIVERTGASGVTIDSVLLKDNGIKTDTGGTDEIRRTKIMQIGDWNMDSTVTVLVAHGLTFAKIRTLSVFIIRDDDVRHTDFPSASPAASTAEFAEVDSTNVRLTRSTGGIFDGVGYDSTSFNRGWITLSYAV